MSEFDSMVDLPIRTFGKNLQNRQKSFDWGFWGITGYPYDLYEDVEQELREAIESGEPFDTDWHGFKKELDSMRIYRENNGEIVVEVSAYMDSVYEDAMLIYDCLTPEEEKLLTDTMIDEILDKLPWGEFVEEIEDSDILPPDSTIEDVMKKANELINECNDRLLESYKICIGITLNVLYGYPEDQSFIEKRINEAR